MTSEWAPECQDLLSFALARELQRRVEVSYLFGSNQIEFIIQCRGVVRYEEAKRKKLEREAHAAARLREMWQCDPMIPREQSVDESQRRASYLAIGIDPRSS